MDAQTTAIAEFVQANRKALANYVRQKLLAAEAKPYLDRLGKEGIELLEREAAGFLLDMSCALIDRLDAQDSLTSEEVLERFPEELRKTIRLPRSDAYHEVLSKLNKD